MAEKTGLNCKYINKNEWNISSYKIEKCNKKLKCLKNARGFTQPYYDVWGLYKESLFGDNWSTSLAKANFVKKGKTYKAEKKASLTIMKYNSSNKKWSSKKVNFYKISGRWIIAKTIAGEKILKDVTNEVKGSICFTKPIGDNNSNNKNNTKKKNNTIKSLDDDLELDDIDDELEHVDSEDLTFDKSNTRLPDGIRAHTPAKFFDKLNKQGYMTDGVESSFLGEEKDDATLNSKGLSKSSVSVANYNHLLRSRGIINEDKHKWNYQFNRMQWSNPYYSIGPTREFLFFTKPDLNLFKRSSPLKLNPELSADSFWVEMKARYRDVMYMLQYSAPNADFGGMGEYYKKAIPFIKSQEFIPLLTNAVSGSLDLPSSSADTTETASTIYGTTLQYRKGAWKSDEGYDFSLEFTDSPYLEVYHLFKMWEEYTKLKDFGLVSPPGGKNLNLYRINKILHDQIGIFKFILDDDMETIIHYSYLTGCFPKSVPRESFNNINPGMISYSIDWHAQFVEDMDPLILVHFNNIVKKYISYNNSNSSSMSNYIGNNFDYIPIYNPKYQHINGGFRHIPVVGRVSTPKNPGRFQYVLRWYDKK